ncbi:MAG: DUF4432 family protein [Caldilineaceae bacterium]|nr:DUF4432 family protein [Caldilineaceae bacterium]
MSDSVVLLHLKPWFFTQREHLLMEEGAFSASAFRFDSGVQAVRLSNGAGELLLLPFQGQQIWSAHFGGRDITMHSMFDEPRATRNYLETYGGFLLHCGATAMGVPTEHDNHPLHGELPNAPYQSAYIVLGEDAGGAYIGLGGRYQHTVAFSTNYVAEPLVKLYAGANQCTASMTIKNLKNTPMELMYMAHANFRPVNDSRLVYSAQATPDHVRVRRSIPSHVQPSDRYLKLLDELEQRPEQHHILSADLACDPEIVFVIDYLADEAGWAHSLQVHPDGSADYIRHRPDQLDKGVRWICRTPDQDALGLVLPATAGPEGYTAEKANGNLKVIPAKGAFSCEMEMGVLNAAEAANVAAQIEHILATRS